MDKKDGLDAKVVGDLRQQFRLRNSAKKEEYNPPKSKMRQALQIMTSSRKKPKNLTTSASKTSTTSETATSSVPKADEDPPTEFEKVANCRPAVFAREWHKFEVPLHQLPGNKKKRSKKKRSTIPRQKKKEPTVSSTEEEKNGKKSNSTGSKQEDHPPPTKTSTTPTATTTAGSSSKNKKRIRTREENAKEVNARRDRRKRKKTITTTIAEKDTTKATTTKVDTNPGVPKEKEKEKEQTSDPKRQSAENIPDVAVDDDDKSEYRTTIRQPILVPVEEQTLKLKPVNGQDQQSQPFIFNPDEEVTAVDDDPVDIGASVRTVMTSSKLLDMNKRGNSNFSMVEASVKVVEFCLEKDMFKEFLPPADYTIFNDFFIGKTDVSERILSIMDNLLERLLDSKKLAETPQLTAEMNQLNKDREEAKNNLLDALISKKAVPVPLKTTSSTTIAEDKGDKTVVEDKTDEDRPDDANPPTDTGDGDDTTQPTD